MTEKTIEIRDVETARAALENLDRCMVLLRDLRRQTDEASAGQRSSVCMDTGLEHYKDLCRRLHSAEVEEVPCA